MKKLFLLITVLLPVLGFSQQFSFNGNVNENISPFNSVENVIVTIEGTSFSTTTDVDGKFSIKGNVPNGEQLVTFTKDGYDINYILIDVKSNGNINLKDIEFQPSKKELKKRKKAQKNIDKSLKKGKKEKEKTLKGAKKEKEKEIKKIAKEKKKLSKKKRKGKGGAAVIATTEVVTQEVSEPDNFGKIQKKYGAILKVSPSNITNKKLYPFIDTWIETPYLIGGETEKGIDCSSFTQRLFINVYSLYIERTAQKQFDSANTDKFLGKEYLQEGDLVFFGENLNNVTHVGVYLGNGKFINSTARKGLSNISGVKISNLEDPYWSRIFLAGGRRTDIK